MKRYKPKTLIEKAKEIVLQNKSTRISTATDEQIELAIGWATDEISLGQITKVLWDKTSAKGVGGKVLYTLACWLKAGVLRGKLKVNK